MMDLKLYKEGSDKWYYEENLEEWKQLYRHHKLHDFLI